MWVWNSIRFQEYSTITDKSAEHIYFLNITIINLINDFPLFPAEYYQKDSYSEYNCNEPLLEYAKLSATSQLRERGPENARLNGKCSIFPSESHSSAPNPFDLFSLSFIVLVQFCVVPTIGLLGVLHFRFVMCPTLVLYSRIFKSYVVLLFSINSTHRAARAVCVCYFTELCLFVLFLSLSLAIGIYCIFFLPIFDGRHLQMIFPFSRLWFTICFLLVFCYFTACLWEKDDPLQHQLRLRRFSVEAIILLALFSFYFLAVAFLHTTLVFFL